MAIFCGVLALCTLRQTCRVLQPVSTSSDNVERNGDGAIIGMFVGVVVMPTVAMIVMPLKDGGWGFKLGCWCSCGCKWYKTDVYALDKVSLICFLLYSIDRMSIIRTSSVCVGSGGGGGWCAHLRTCNSSSRRLRGARPYVWRAKWGSLHSGV